MRTRRHGWLLGLLLAGTIAGFAALFSLRLNHGDSFPRYSSLRADPLGTRALYDSLARLPGLRVDRVFTPLGELGDAPGRTVIVAGMHPRRLEGMASGEFLEIERAARAGARVVIALAGVQDTFEPPPENPEDTSKPVEGKKNGEQDVGEEKRLRLTEHWGFTTGVRWRPPSAARGADAPAGLPESVRWSSDLYFRPAADGPWQTVYTRGGESVMMVRTFGRGTVVLAGDAFFLSNESLQRARAPDLLVWLLGTSSLVQFHEGHLGVIEDRGIARLARSYGLGPAALAFAAVALLFAWRRMALFVPPPAEVAETGLVYRQTAGLEALYRRTFAPGELAAACLTEWRRTARAADRARVEAAVAACPRGASPATVYNAVAQALRRR